jgi:hypothetical protein
MDKQVVKDKKLIISYEESEWRYPATLGIKQKMLYVCREHFVNKKKLPGYFVFITITDKEGEQNQEHQLRNLYLVKKKQALISLHNYIQECEGLNDFDLQPTKVK